MLEPLTLARQLLLWTSSVDEDSDEVSQWSFWGYDYAAQRGVGNYYVSMRARASARARERACQHLRATA